MGEFRKSNNIHTSRDGVIAKEQNRNAPDSIDATASNEENGNHSQGVASSRKRGNQESTETSCISNNVENSSNAQNHDKSSVSKKISSSEPSLSTNEESSFDSIAGGRPKRTRR